MKTSCLLLASSTIRAAKGHHPPAGNRKPARVRAGFHRHGQGWGCPERRRAWPHQCLRGQVCQVQKPKTAPGWETPDTGQRRWDRAPEGRARSWQDLSVHVFPLHTVSIFPNDYLSPPAGRSRRPGPHPEDASSSSAGPRAAGNPSCSCPHGAWPHRALQACSVLTSEYLQLLGISS